MSDTGAINHTNRRGAQRAAPLPSVLPAACTLAVKERFIATTYVLVL
jgi:hypothetical protein